MAKRVKKKAAAKPKNRTIHGTYEKSDIMKRFTLRLNTLREEKGIQSMETFAHEIGISRVSISNYMRGNLNDVQLWTIFKILDGLDISAKEFFSEGFD